jgi:membrane associated rhomboid family serine protease
MAHDHKEKKEEINFNALYYLTGLVCGLFTGWIIDKGFTWIFVGGVLGLLTAALFLQVFVRGREER